ncbi:protein FRA10AC1-like isoform X1 [Varroa jacobsoni]|uniref:protein FRA10AC1-like isoform X1 n=1 Tax=Varroa jacobsoni TaxID=62625 RepID=UPI000BFA10B5|nr:protein FRA10AC1-like isoform X1 [Varroa jacobsoni]XP_022691613.1 protein FRA10AC1-like isoform X1 [Varroa jacobsoni]XP_022691614.1 protein FRA10AC1-like isoform X1 [Varroa jacobsoni]XP_022691615.1 protein FRA10AC1-like isoform X1 [Varroa jacobsoni]
MSEFEYNDNLVPCTGNDYDSSFESDTYKLHKSNRNIKATDEFQQPVHGFTASSSAHAGHDQIKGHKSQFCSEQSRAEKRRERYAILALDAYSRHKKLVNDYLLCYKGQTAHLKRDICRDKNDGDVLRENHRFLWDDECTTSDLTWGQRLAKKYYDKLFKEYCVTDLRFYKKNKIAFRWRTEQEVVVGKGQFSCGEKNCINDADLRSWEVNFAYVEQNERKNALVKIRLCPDCSYKLNYRTQRKEVTKKRKRKIEQQLSKMRKIEKKGNKKRRQSKPKKIKKKQSRSLRDEDSSSDSSGGFPSEDEKANLDNVKVIEEKHVDNDNPWAKPVQIQEESNLDDEFDLFLDEMFL